MSTAEKYAIDENREKELIDRFLDDNVLFLGPDPEIMENHDISPRTERENTAMKNESDPAVLARGIIRFAIDFLEDPVFDSVTLNDWKRLDEAMTDIPHPTNIPKSHRGSLHLRYLYAKDNKWKKLRRASTTTVMAWARRPAGALWP